ncbi:hypothetical protein [Benzoatithermus flavus]|uniref:Uncharacterized protein n=1 Tax=Benzoatithermus flavus TaxID=3108223 RepID=A0ABU8XRE5_9PROT
MSTLSPSMPVQHRRRRALTELDAVIDRAERMRDRCLLDVQDRKDAGKGLGRAGAMLRVAEERLELLYRSRRALLESEGEEG